jgi:protein O-GlcNAc transferase
MVARPAGAAHRRRRKCWPMQRLPRSMSNIMTTRTPAARPIVYDLAGFQIAAVNRIEKPGTKGQRHEGTKGWVAITLCPAVAGCPFVPRDGVVSALKFDMDRQRTFEQAVAHHRSGRLAEAAALYRQILQSNPNDAEALQMLGLAAHQGGNTAEALELVGRAIAVNPHAAAYRCHLGILLGTQKRWDQAIASFREAIRLDPRLGEAHQNLGNALRLAGKPDEAIAAYRRAIELRPEHADSVSARLILINLLLDARKLGAAVAAYREALARKPNWAELRYDLGNTLWEMKEIDQAIDEFRTCLRDRPDFAPALNNLAMALKDVRRLDESLECFSRSEALAPNAAVGSNLLYVAHFHPKYDAKMLLAAHRAWNARYAAPLAGGIRPHANDRSPDRPLRIGYSSPNFRGHSVGLLIFPLLKHHDRENFQVYCYSDAPVKDQKTEAIRATATCWRDTAALSDEQLAEQVRADRVDILVDLTLHMANNRMLAFARKPAPIAVTYLGYASTSGLDTIDYRISDRFIDPPAVGGQPTAINDAYTEQAICLSGPYWCFDPGTDQPPVNSSPAAERGYVTFGCLNNFCKVNEPLLELWAQIMSASANSKILIVTPRGEARRRVQQFMAHRGIEPARVEFADIVERSLYLQTYHRIDLCLDPFPCNGGTTTLEAAWMGVPTISLAGQTAVSRGGLTILSHLGLGELATSSGEQYVRAAIELAGDRETLGRLRSELRERMRNSPLMDGRAFARDFETVYRRIWRRWCSAADEA